MSGITDFIARWEVSGASERANYQLFLSELAEVLGFERPHPATGTPDLDAYRRKHHRRDGPEVVDIIILPGKHMVGAA